MGRLQALFATFVGIAALGGPPAAPVQAPDVSGLTDAQLIGQRIVVGYDGAQPSKRIRQAVARGEIAGVIVFGRNIASRGQLASAVKSLQAIKRLAGLTAPLLIMIDQE